MASSKTFLLLGLVFTVFILIFSEVSARELAETSNQLEKSGGNDQEEGNLDNRYGGGSSHVGKGHPCHKAHKRNCGGEHGYYCDPRKRNCGGEHGPYCDPQKRNCGGEHGSYCDPHKRNCTGEKGKVGRYERPGGPGSDDEIETKN